MTDPAMTDPAMTDPAMTDPAMTDPAMTDRAMTDRAVVDRPTPQSPPGSSRPADDGDRRRLATTMGASCALAAALGLAYLLAPPMGTDLSAQVARGGFFASYGFTPIDFRWYGGVNQLGYSLVSPAIIAAIGARWAGVLAALVLTVALAYVLVRTGAGRPTLGACAIAVVAVGNLASGRTTFAIGIAFAAVAFALLVGRAGGPRGGARAAIRVCGGLMAAIATVTSPVAGLFAGLAAVAWMIGDARWDRSVRGRARPGPRFLDATALAAGAMVGLIPMAWLSEGGSEPFSAASMRISVALALAVGLLVPRACRALRAGAALAIVLLLFAYAVPTGIGSNAMRLPMLFGIPVVIAFSAWRRWALVAALVGLFWWQSPIMVNDITQAGAPETHASFYRPLLTELHTLDGPEAIGRIEVVPLRDHWESVYVADQVPLARGWLRQVDVDRNPLFYSDSPPTAAAYGTWLRSNAVRYLAVAPGQPLDVYGRSEAAIVESRPAYLRLVWHSADWELFEVADPAPFVMPGTLESVTPVAVTVNIAHPGPATIRVSWSSWLTVTGGACLVPAADGWTTMRAPAAGTFTISSSVGSGGRSGDAC